MTDGGARPGGERLGPAGGRAVVVMGVSACGKTKVGIAMARRLGAAFVDGDDLHPADNVRKMAAGVALNDDDRWPWLDRIGAMLRDREAFPGGVVLACSALRKVYRDRIRQAVGDDLVFVFLDVTPAEARRRIDARQGHYMPPSLLESQFRTLERPDGEPDVETLRHLDGVEAVAARAVQVLRARAREALSTRRATLPVSIDP